MLQYFCRSLYKPIIGNHSKYNGSNGNSKKLIEFAIERDLRIVTTNFQHLEIHKGIRISPGGRTINRIDHVAIASKHLKNVLDVRSYRVTDMDTILVRLSTTLFNIILDAAVTESEILTNGTIYNQRSQIIAYADDMVILARIKENLIIAIKRIEKAAKSKGSEINEYKTKFMLVVRTAGNIDNRGLKIKRKNQSTISKEWTVLII